MILRPFLLGLLLLLQPIAFTYGQKPDSTVTVAAGKHYLKSGFHRFWFGTHYRKVWAEPVEVPLIWVSEFKGGVKPIQQGGSFQTKNLRVEDSLGREFVLRSIDKDPSKALPAKWRNSFVADLMRDQTTVIQPYGAFIVPPLASAAGIYHTNPILLYIPDDPALGEFQKEFANTLILVEERPDDESWAGLASFGNPENIISSKKAFDKLLKNPEYKVDAKLYLRSRLFDMWLSDWSRREDQWRWGEKKSGNEVILSPIPRDRDHAFFQFNDGVVPLIFGLFKPNYQSFDASINKTNVKGLISASKQMDSYILTYLTKEEFLEESRNLQNSLPTNVIKEALGQWPEQIRNLSEANFLSKLTSRREDLTLAAEAFYSIINKDVKLAGSDGKDVFEVTFQPDGNVLVKHFSAKNGQENVLLNQRLFLPTQTRSLSIYGLDGADQLVLKGKGKNKMKISWYGGEGTDSLLLNEDWEITGKKIVVMDEEAGNDYPKHKMLKKKDYSPLAKEFSADGWLLRHRLH